MRDWRATILKPDDTMENSIHTIGREGLRIVMVADVSGKLVGIVTDGDIRRALIKRKSMDTCLIEIMNKKPTTISVGEDRQAALGKMHNKDIQQLPVLDTEGKIVGLETMHHLLQRQIYNNPVLLMAGGFGRRLKPLTNDLPKPLLKVGTKPLLETILKQFVDLGFHNFFISTHYKAKTIRNHFGDGSKWDSTIQYIHEEKPLGTAGALGLLPKNSVELPLLLMNADLLTMVRFDRLLIFHNEHGGVATMCVRKYDFEVPYGVVESEGQQITSLVEKPIQKFFVNAGIYILSPSLVETVKRNIYLDMTDLLKTQIQEHRQINMFPLHEYWLDIGKIDEYQRANDEIKNMSL
jgi:dTDP-glucose pyrophosphorylase/predicted transcriptional regulator